MSKKMLDKKGMLKFYSPTKNDGHVDKVLTNISKKYVQENFIADAVLPVVPVKKESDKYFTYTRDWRLPEAGRAPGAEANEIDYDVDTETYSCEEYALKKKIPDRVRNNMDKPLNADIDATNAVTEFVQMLREKRVADIAFAAGSYGTQTSALAGVNRWDDYANSDPIQDVQDAKDTIHAASGKFPNVMVMGYQVYSKLINHPDFLERIKYTQKGLMSADLMASLFEIDKLLVGKAIYDTSQEGGTESLSYIWGKNVSLVYAQPSPGLQQVSFGYQFESRGFRTKKWREEKIESDWVESGEIRDEHLVAADTGYLYTTVIS